MRVLMIDDDDGFRDAVSKWVNMLNKKRKNTEQSLELTVTADVETFLSEVKQTAKSAQGALLLIDLDILGDKVAGIRILRRLRRNPRKFARLLPAIIYSNSSEIEEVNESYQSKANSFVWKGEGHEQRARFEELVLFWADIVTRPTVSEEATHSA